MTLFELDAAELDLLGKIEAIYENLSGDLNEPGDPGAEAEALVDAHLDQLAEVQDQLGAKLAGYVKAIRAKRAKAALYAAELDLYRAEMDRLKRLAAGEDDTADFLESRLQAFLERRGLREFEAGTYTLKIVNQGGALPVILADGVQPEDLPEAYHKVIPARVEIDKKALAADLKDGKEIMITVKDDEAGEREIRAAWLGERGTVLKIK